MATSIPIELRRTVIERANQRCEYCRKPVVGFFAHEVDHVIAQKHGGATVLTNLAFACFECNRYKAATLPLLIPRHMN